MNTLEELLAVDPKAIVSSVNASTRSLLDANPGGIVFFGAGPLGKVALKRARNAGVVPIAFADNNPSRWGTECEGVPIISTQEAASRFGKNCTFVITVYTSAPVWAQLRSLGVEPISLARFGWLYSKEFLPFYGYNLPFKVFDNISAVYEAGAIWADGESRKEFVEQIRWRTTLSPEVLRSHPPASDTYFAPDLFSFHDHEVFVDCGAYDGDSIKPFVEQVKGNFERIIGLEPDPLNRDRFEKFRQALPTAQANRIELLPFALGDKRERLEFDVTGTVVSVLGSGKNIVDCVPLDEVVTIPPTYIKMDIEGAEPAALRGAVRLIRDHRPILSICLYHAIEHIWEIPLWVKRLVPEYHLFLRRYSDECWEQILYAIPPERVTKKSS